MLIVGFKFSQSLPVKSEESVARRVEDLVHPEMPLGAGLNMRRVSGTGVNHQKSSPLRSAKSVEDIDYDCLYDNQSEDEFESLEAHGSVISHIMSQVKIGMDLTKVVLPTFILERRSLLEMYADFFAHPDMFVGIADGKTPRDRMVAVLRWF